jgi:hypothetical protein
LQPVGEGEVQLRRLMGFAVAQYGLRFARVVVAVMTKEYDFTAQFSLEPSGRPDFCDEETFGEEPARLLTEAYDRDVAHGR